MIRTTMKMDVWHFADEERATITNALLYTIHHSDSMPSESDREASRKLLKDLGWDNSNV